MDWAITAVITTFNRADIIPDAINSVFSQTQAVSELIVVDDGSSDHTECVVTTLFRGSPIPCRYIKKTNGGMATSLNRGIDEAVGDWIAFLDDDDLWSQDHIERCMNIVGNQPGLECIAGLRHEKGVLQTIPEHLTDQFERIDINGPILVRRRAPLWAPFFTPVVGTAVVKKELFKKIRFSTEVGARLDIHFFWRLAQLTDVAIDARSHGVGRQFRISYLSTDDEASQDQKNKIIIKRNADEIRMLKHILEDDSIVDKNKFRQIYKRSLIGKAYLLRNMGDFPGAYFALKACAFRCSVIQVLKEFILIFLKIRTRGHE